MMDTNEIQPRFLLDLTTYRNLDTTMDDLRRQPLAATGQPPALLIAICTATSLADFTQSAKL